MRGAERWRCVGGSSLPLALTRIGRGRELHSAGRIAVLGVWGLHLDQIGDLEICMIKTLRFMDR